MTDRARHERLDQVLSAAQSGPAEPPGSTSAERNRDLAAYADGEITAAELYRRTVARYRRRENGIDNP